MICRLMLIGIVAMTFACRGGVIPETEVPATLPIAVATPLAKLEYKRDAELEKQFAEIAKAAGGKVGVAAVVLETGEAAFLNEDGRYPMQSVYKLPIAMALMEQVRLGKFDLDEKVGVTKEDFVRAGMRSPLRDENPNGGEFTIRELIRLSLVESDGTASDVQLRLVPPVDVQSFLTQIGVRDMKVVNTEKEIGKDWKTQYENWSTPVAAVELLRWLDASSKVGPDGKIPEGEKGPWAATALLIQLMTNSNPGQNRLKGMLPKTMVAHKTGTGGTQNGITGATNDIGIIDMPNRKTLAIAVFVSDSPADEKTREATIAKIAKAAWDRWTKGQAPVESPAAARATCWTDTTPIDRPICEAVFGKVEFNAPDFKDNYRGPVTLDYALRDLNGDGRTETIAWESSWAGTSGGMLWILTDRNGRTEKVFETEMTWSPIFVLKAKHHGWNDLVYLMTGGGVKPDFITVRHNGKKYALGTKVTYQREDGDLSIPDGEEVIGKGWKQSMFGPMPTPEG